MSRLTRSLPRRRPDRYPVGTQLRVRSGGGRTFEVVEVERDVTYGVNYTDPIGKTVRAKVKEWRLMPAEPSPS